MLIKKLTTYCLSCDTCSDYENIYLEETEDLISAIAEKDSEGWQGILEQDICTCPNCSKIIDVYLEKRKAIDNGRT